MIQVSSGYLHKFGPVFGPEHRTLVPAFILFTTIIILFKEMIQVTDCLNKLCIKYFRVGYYIYVRKSKLTVIG